LVKPDFKIKKMLEEIKIYKWRNEQLMIYLEGDHLRIKKIKILPNPKLKTENTPGTLKKMGWNIKNKNSKAGGQKVMKTCKSPGCNNLVATRRSRFCYSCIARAKREKEKLKTEKREFYGPQKNKKTVYVSAYSIPALLTGDKLIRAFNQVIEHKLRQ